MGLPQIIQSCVQFGTRRGIVPKDLSIISYDNTLPSILCEPALTSIEQPIDEMGKKVVKLLMEEIKEPKKIKLRVVLST